MRFSDGSSMRNDFSNIRINESLEATLFTLDEAAGYYPVSFILSDKGVSI
jgi:outer membrane lipoprotein-sorting protein